MVIYHLFENAKQIRVEALEVRNHGMIWSSHRHGDVLNNLRWGKLLGDGGAGGVEVGEVAVPTLSLVSTK